MNVTYDEINARDAAQRIGVDYTTVVGWCRNNLINYTNLSDGSKNGRYMLAEAEVEYLKRLNRTYDTRKAMMHYQKDWNKAEPKAEPKAVIKNVDLKPVAPTPQSKIEDAPKKANFNADKVLDQILKIQDLKERLEDLEAEKNQIMAELEMIRKDIMEVI